MVAVSDVVGFFVQIEGPYKWYAIGVVLAVLTAFVTRFIFKTLKWFLIIAAAAVIVFTIVTYLTDVDLL